jgi:hypothetical protein
MTREEAFEYVKMEYVGAHKKDTLPAEPAMGKLPADLRVRLESGMYHGIIYVVVSKDGFADVPFLNPECTRKSDDPYLVSLVQNLRFKPALDKGTPVAGKAALDLSKLPI